jgi:hypothetical protein
LSFALSQPRDHCDPSQSLFVAQFVSNLLCLEIQYLMLRHIMAEGKMHSVSSFSERDAASPAFSACQFEPSPFFPSASKLTRSPALLVCSRLMLANEMTVLFDLVAK